MARRRRSPRGDHLCDRGFGRCAGASERLNTLAKHAAFILGTRASPLALAQVELTRNALARRFPELPIEVRKFTTRGDQKLDLSLLRMSEAGGKGLFTKELEEALLAGAIDVAVHSLKDLPGHNPPGLEVTAVLERAPTADTLITRAAADFDALAKRRDHRHEQHSARAADLLAAT